MTIRAITFDFWGTLYKEVDEVKAARQEHQLQVALSAFRRMGVEPPKAAVRQALANLYQRVDWLWRNEQRAMSGQELGQWFGVQLGYEIEAESGARLADMLAVAVVSYPPRLPVGVNGVLEALKKGHKLAVISDTGVLRGNALREVMRRDQLDDYFQHFTFSDETMTTKPQRRQFLYTLSMLDVAPSEAVHVGDMEQTDIAGAKASGMRAVLLSPDGAPATRADAVVADLQELPELLRSWTERS